MSKKNPFSSQNFTLNADDNKFLFPDKWHKTKGYSVYGFSFVFKKSPSTINDILKPTDNLINDFQNDNTEEVNNSLSTNSFFDEKTFKEKVEEFKAIPTKEFINESFFLYDKSNTIMRTFITALNKEISIYGSFSYFSGKESAKNLKLIDISNHLKFLIEKKAIRKDLKLHLAYVNGNVVKTKDKKIHDFSITQLGKRQKNMLSTPIDTTIIRAQQDFDVVGGLNPVQVEITDSRIINKLAKYKNVAYKITPPGLLFRASITNDTNRIIVTSTKISGAKKAILNYKLYDLIADIDLSKISNWTDIKGQSIWVNAQFKDHKEINNASHLCFPFVTRTLSDLTSFRINLQDDQNKKIEFKSGEKKTCILNFQVDVYLT